MRMLKKSDGVLTSLSTNTEYSVLQKLVGAIIFILGLITVPLSDGDGTAFVFLLIFAVPLLLSKDKLEYYGDDNDDE